jgi:hypothetical protein
VKALGSRRIHDRRRHRIRAVAAAVLALLAVPTGAQGSIGTGVGTNPLQLSSQAEPGHRYRLPSLYVVNTGSQGSDYLVRVERLGDKPGRDVPAAWIRFARTRVRLAPHKSALIRVILVVPSGAAHGTYRSNVVVGTSTPGLARGAALGAAAATEVIFRVGGPGAYLWSSSWLLYSVAGLIAVGLLRSFVRRLGLQVRIERLKA